MGSRVGGTLESGTGSAGGVISGTAGGFASGSAGLGFVSGGLIAMVAHLWSRTLHRFDFLHSSAHAPVYPMVVARPEFSHPERLLSHWRVQASHA